MGEKNGKDKEEFVPCCKVHPGLRCEEKAWYTFRSMLVSTMKMYAPLHFLPLLVLRPRQLVRDGPRGAARVLWETLVHTVRSALFLSLFGSSFSASICLTRRLRGRDDPWNQMVGGFVCGAALLMEIPGRRGEIALYCIPRFLEIAWNMVKARLEHRPAFRPPYTDADFLDSIPAPLSSRAAPPQWWMRAIERYGDVAVFSLAMSVLLYCYEKEPECIKPTYRSLFKMVFA
jgi:hypothetical protein